MPKNIVNLLLVKAQHDLNAAELLTKSDPEFVGYESIGFHLQQAVEKSTKALLCRNGIPYGYIHDINLLFDDVASKLLPIPNQFTPLKTLTPYATKIRYETAKIPIQFDCQAFLILVSEYMDWIVAVMEGR